MRRMCITFLAMIWAVGAQAQAPMTVGAATLDTYAGSYEMDAKHLLVVTREGDHLLAHLGAQPEIELVAQSRTSFSPKGIAAEIAFQLDASGTVSAAVIRQNGREITMPRLTPAQAQAIAALPAGHPMAVTWPQMGISPRILTPAGAGFDVWPCISPDGGTVLFSRSTDRGQTWRLYKVAMAGGDAVPFAELPVSATRCAWSAHGIAFTGLAADHTAALWVMQADGSGAHAVTLPELSKQVFYPSWDPDGQSLVVMDAESLTIRRIDLAAGTVTAMTDRAQVLSGMPSLAPDGKTVAFAGQANKGQRYDQEENTVWLAGNGAARPLETPPLQGRAPVWSPDGNRIAFESDRGNDKGHYAVFVINRDGTGLTQLTDFALDATHPVFTRDSRHMVFSHGGGVSGIAVIDLP